MKKEDKLTYNPTWLWEANRLKWPEVLKRLQATPHGKEVRFVKPKKLTHATKVVAQCQEHGDYEQTVRKHMTHPCPGCIRDTKAAATKKEFLKRAKAKYGKRFDYSRVEMEEMRSVVTIGCPEHGRFQMPGGRHIAKRKSYGCPKCGRIAAHNNTAKGYDQFVKEARATHGDRYEYPKNGFTTRKNVRIVCSKHGEFEQGGTNHLKGHGCPACGRSNTMRNNYTRKEVKLESGKTVLVHGYEPRAIAYLEAQGIRQSRLRFGEDVPVIWHHFDGKKRRYYPDMRYGKTLVEVKSWYTWACDLEHNRVKLRAANAEGYNVRLIVLNKAGSCIMDIEKRADGSEVEHAVNMDILTGYDRRKLLEFSR